MSTFALGERRVGPIYSTSDLPKINFPSLKSNCSLSKSLQKIHLNPPLSKGEITQFMRIRFHKTRLAPTIQAVRSAQQYHVPTYVIS
jgi:hypothetical protein